MSKISTVVPKDTYVNSMFAKYFSTKFYQQHAAEINSTSPYAVTDKVPKMRVVDNPITKGSGSISPIRSEPHYGFFGGYKGSSMSGGGGSWELDTKVQFDHISMCPITGREFTDAELEKYYNDWSYQVRQHGETEARQMTRQYDPSNMHTIFRYYKTTFVFNQEDLESLQMQARSNNDLVKFIESHIK